MAGQEPSTSTPCLPPLVPGLDHDRVAALRRHASASNPLKSPRELHTYNPNLKMVMEQLLETMVQANCSEFRFVFGMQEVVVRRSPLSIRPLSTFDEQKVRLLQAKIRQFLSRRRLIKSLNAFTSSGAAASMRKRGNLLKELIATEITYHETLEKCCAHFLYPLRQSNFGLQSSFLNDVFMNIEDIHQSSASFLASLQERMAQWPSVSTIGDVISQHVKKFSEHYARYLVGYKSSLMLFSDELQRNEPFSDWYKAKLSELKLTGLASYMITPVQRLPRYQMILSGLIGSTAPDHNDSPLLNACLELIMAATSEINKCEAQRADALRVLETVNLEEMLPSLRHALEYHGRLLCEGKVRLVHHETFKKLNSHHAFLFNRALLLCSTDKKGPVVQRVYQWNKLSPSDIVLYRHNDATYFRFKVYEAATAVLLLLDVRATSSIMAPSATPAAQQDALDLWRRGFSSLLQKRLYKDPPPLKLVEHSSSSQALHGALAVIIKEAQGVAPVGETYVQVEWIDQSNFVAKKTMPQPSSHHPKFDSSLTFLISGAVPDKSTIRISMYDLGTAPPALIGETLLPYFSLPESPSHTTLQPIFAPSSKAMTGLLHLSFEWTLGQEDLHASSAIPSSAIPSSSASIFDPLRKLNVSPGPDSARGRTGTNPPPVDSKKKSKSPSRGIFSMLGIGKDAEVVRQSRAVGGPGGLSQSMATSPSTEFLSLSQKPGEASLNASVKSSHRRTLSGGTGKKKHEQRPSSQIE